jgi:hypothetical protein
LAALEENPDHEPELDNNPPTFHPNPLLLHPNPPPCLHQIYPEYIPPAMQQLQISQPPPMPYDPKSPLT